jgi:hypothetical protein
MNELPYLTANETNERTNERIGYDKTRTRKRHGSFLG